MPPAIHPVDLIEILRRHRLTPAIVFLTSRRACDEAIDTFAHSSARMSTQRSEAIREFLEKFIKNFPSVEHHPLIPVVQEFGVAAHHAGHLPSWKIAIEELMRQGLLDAVFATTTLAAGVDFPARTVVITQSSVRKSQDFTDLTNSEIQQLAGRGGRRGKDLVGVVVITPSPYIDLNILGKGLTGYPEPIDSQFVVSYPMVLNLLKAHSLDQIEGLLAKSFAQFQLNQRSSIHQDHLDQIKDQLTPYGPRECADWITQWKGFDLARRRKAHRHPIVTKDTPFLTACLPFLTPGRLIGLPKGPAIILRQYRSRGTFAPMLSVIRAKGTLGECPAHSVTQVYDRLFEFQPSRTIPWCQPQVLAQLKKELSQLPARLPTVPILPETQETEDPLLAEILTEEFPCPTCPSHPACKKDFPLASKLRQKSQQLTKTIQALRDGLWHRFQQKADVLHKFGYITANSQLTADGEWARLIRINHSLLITELIRMEAFSGIAPGLLAGVMASISHDDDRPGSYMRLPSGLASMLTQVRAVADSLSPYEPPPLLRSDVAALVESWIGNPQLTWASLVRSTSMAEGDVYRLLARTLEFLSQIYGLKVTHPGLADTAHSAMVTMRREVLQELP
ncbi:helicase-related protein [Candidatus Nitrospira neomarina]|uniref:Helicase-related protein n=1 Tax=Candidatus Nitrospira neomarina TaxID=3020899 RepID=A0AA96GL94_9BACT|nr:helicase-related protein [Candidatus Nitrospira neomarina]WNM63293.1 helicase-related protein [Candidatus Nitrospira neomarina]